MLFTNPTLPLDNIVNGSDCYRKLSRKRGGGFSVLMPTSDRVGNLLRQLCHSITLPTRTSSLCGHIFLVFCARTKKQVRWVDAKPNVAPMKHTHTFWYFPKVNQIREAMRTHLVGSDASALTVPAVSLRGRPQPTSVRIRRFLDLLKEPFDGSLRNVQGVPPSQESTRAATGTLTTSPVTFLPVLSHEAHLRSLVHVGG